MLDYEIRDSNGKEDITSIDCEVRRLVMNSRKAIHEKYHGMHPDLQMFDYRL